MIKKVWNEESSKMTKWDYLILGIIVLLYAILSFTNLGSLKNPQTFYELDQKEEITFYFESRKDLIRMKIFNGELDGTYQIYTSVNDKDYIYISEIEGSGSFSWSEAKVLQQVTSIKVISQEQSTLGSITFYDNSQNKIPVAKISSSLTNKNNLKTLIDEQNMTPDKINYLNSSYFDEIYFARTAYEYAHGIEAYEWVHPPLGKIIQAIPIKVFNTMAPFFYRLMGNIAGILMIIVMYIFSKQLFKKRKFAILGSLLMTFDTFHFAQTRMGTVDSFLVLFIMISYYYMYKYLKDNKTKNLLLSGLFFGLSTSVKWTGLYAGCGLAIIFFIYITKNKLWNLKLIGKCIIYYLVIPLAIYIGSYLLFPNVQVTYTNNIDKIIEQTEKMYHYHSTLDETHPFSSKWYTWPLSYKPVWYYQGEVDEGSHGTIVGVGNIVIWYLGFLSILYLLYRLIKKKDKETLLIIVGYLCLWLPYIFIGRCMFLYHYFPALPFMMLSIVALFKQIDDKWKTDIPMIIYTIIFISFFAIYYPAISGIKVSDNYLYYLKLFSSWIF